MNIKSNSRIAVLLASLVLLSMAGPALAAPTVDTTTSPSPETSDITDGYTHSNYNASGNLGWLNASYDTDNPGLDIIDPETGEVVKSIASSSSRWNEYDAANNSYGINLSETDFATVEMDANEQKNVTLRMDGNTSSDAASDFTNITITLNNTDERAVVRVQSATGAEADVEENEPGALSDLFGADAENMTTVEKDNVGIAGSNTTVYVVYADDTAAEPFETAAEEKSGLFVFGSSDYESGDRIKDHILTVEGTYYGVYSSEAPDEVVDNEDATYAEWTTVDGVNAHAITLGEEEYDGETTADVMTVGNDTPGFTTDIKTYEDDLLSGLLG